MFDTPNDLMWFIYDNKDNNDWFTTDCIIGDNIDWNILSDQFDYLIRNGYIKPYPKSMHMFIVLRRPD